MKKKSKVNESANKSEGELTYDYDVAFSFHADDERLATEIEGLVAPTCKTFLYSNQQVKLAGFDGEKIFSEVFRHKARSVVVLYREEWGNTPWTRIEQEAIRARAHDNGYEFCLFVPVGEGTTLPAWIPPIYIYGNLKRWGVKGLASVIEERITHLGGHPKKETIKEHAKRFQIESEWLNKKMALLTQSEGMDRADKLFQSTSAAMETKLQSIAGQLSTAQPAIHKAIRSIAINNLGNGILIGWFVKYSNSLSESFLSVSKWNPAAPLPHLTYWEVPKKVSDDRYHIEFKLNGDDVWLSSSNEEYSADRLADKTIKQALQELLDKQTQIFRNSRSGQH